MNRTRLLLVGVTLLPLLGSCADARDVDPSEARAALIDYFHRQAEGQGTVSFTRGLHEVLPNVTFQPAGGEAFVLNDIVVVGDVVDVEDGVAKHWSEERNGTPTDFEDPTADSRTLLVVVGTIEQLAGEPVGERIQLEMTLGGGADVDLLREGLRGLGRVALLLDTDRVDGDDYDEPVYTGSGRGVMTIDADGIIDLPLRDPRDVPAWQGEITTLDALRRALAQPERTIELAGSRGSYERVDNP